MAVTSIFKRLFGFGRFRTMEDIQRQLLNYLHSHGGTTPVQFINHFYADQPGDIILREVLQAAQILANRGEIEARQNGHTIDPIRGNETTQLRIRPH